MAWQQSDLSTLESAIASGVQKVRYADGREVFYQQTDQMVAARRVIIASLEVQDAAAKGLVRRKFASYRSGF